MATTEGSNMYEFVSGTKNPLCGECPHGCTYCSTNNLKRYPVIAKKYSGQIRLDYKVLSGSLGNNNLWFIVGQNDLFARGVPDSFILEVLSWCRRFDNTYLFQTKNPDGYIQYLSEFPEKTILCTTIETNRWYDQMGKAPLPFDRAFAMNSIYAFPKYVTIEPIMDFDMDDMVATIKMCNPTQVNVGADSKRNHLPEPSKDKILSLIGQLEQFTTVKKKSNLERLLR